MVQTGYVLYHSAILNKCNLSSATTGMFWLQWNQTGNQPQEDNKKPQMPGNQETLLHKQGKKETGI